MHIALVLPTHYRRDFAKTRSFIVKGDFTRHPLIRNATRVTCVGDIVSRYCIEGMEPGKLVLIVDGKTRRQVREGLGIIEEAKRLGMRVLHVENPPGTITIKGIDTVCKAVNSREGVLIAVKGEEDMLALPAIACSHENHLVVYGIPGKGATLIKPGIYTARDVQLRLLYLKPGIVWLEGG